MRCLFLFVLVSSPLLAASPLVTGELKQWHKITLTLDGPRASEADENPNPFTDYRFTVRFRHESGNLEQTVPGYFAADGQAGESSASSGTKWRAHWSPERTGKWFWEASFVKGKLAALDPSIAGEPVPEIHGAKGELRIEPTDKKGRDFRARGRLQYVRARYLRFAGTGEYFLKAGADAPETLLACVDFDATQARRANAPLKTWAPHLKDWRPGDPTWKSGKGKGLIGAINYLADKGLNAVSFLTYNAGGDGDNVWPFTSRDAKLHYDCSKLDQWQIVLDHAQSRGLFLHFKLQETEMDDNREGAKQQPAPTSLDGGALGAERKLYCRELIARFAYLLALNWNLGEENTQSTEEQRAMAGFIRQTDPYAHPIVVHTFPDWQDRVYTPLLGPDSPFTGASLQNAWNRAHERTLKWVRESETAGKPWVVANDEQNPADLGVPPDPGFNGFSGRAGEGDKPYDLHDIRKQTLWGTLLAGGAGVEYYFGYKLPEHDLILENWRSRDKSWNFCRIALEFFHDEKIPFWEMRSSDALVDVPPQRRAYCFAKPGGVYLIYLLDGGSATVDLTGSEGEFAVTWFNPRIGGPLRRGSVHAVRAGRRVALGDPPAEPNDDWLAVLRRK